MAELIRRIKDVDFEEVSGLFEQGNSVEELLWLFADPNDSTKYNAFVVVDIKNDIIVGVIGYELSRYTQFGREIIGVLPFSWKLKPGYKGFAGVSLYKEVSKLGEIGVNIGSSEIAKKISLLFKYKSSIQFDKYYKILNTFNFFLYFKNKDLIKSLAKYLYLVPSYFFRLSKLFLDKNISLTPYDGNNFVKEKEFKNIFKKEITKNYINWLLDCPIVKTYAFVIKKEDESLGICVLNIKKDRNLFIGRIVHLPFLGYDKKVWISVIEKCLIFLKGKGCCVVSGIAIDEMGQKGYSKSGFIRIKKLHKPILIKDVDKKITEFNIYNWHFQFSEGDISIRNFSI